MLETHHMRTSGASGRESRICILYRSMFVIPNDLESIFTVWLCAKPRNIVKLSVLRTIASYCDGISDEKAISKMFYALSRVRTSFNFWSKRRYRTAKNYEDKDSRKNLPATERNEKIKISLLYLAE